MEVSHPEPIGIGSGIESSGIGSSEIKGSWVQEGRFKRTIKKNIKQIIALETEYSQVVAIRIIADIQELFYKRNKC
jgi:hypothetical protein